MAKKQSNTAEFAKLSVAELHKEATASRGTIAKLRLSLRLQKEKDSAKYQREKKKLARMLTVINQKKAEESLQQAKTAATVSAPKTESTPESTSSTAA